MFGLAAGVIGAALFLYGFEALGVFFLLCSVVLLFRALRPFRFRILPEGLDVRHRGIARTVPWSEIDAVVLEQPLPARSESVTPAPRLLLVPAAGSALPAQTDARHPVDGRAARVLLETSDVRGPVDDIARQLTLVSGGRFADLRDVAAAPPAATRAGDADFTIVLRGYALPEVDQLISIAQAALDSDDPERRAAALPRLTNPDFEVALRGYDRGQVDAHLKRLAAELSVR